MDGWMDGWMDELLTSEPTSYNFMEMMSWLSEDHEVAFIL